MIFFFNDTATTEIYTLSLHDALPICAGHPEWGRRHLQQAVHGLPEGEVPQPDGPGRADRLRQHARQDADLGDRKSTRLNSSHANISYAVFCLKKKKSYRFAHHSSHID